MELLKPYIGHFCIWLFIAAFADRNQGDRQGWLATIICANIFALVTFGIHWSFFL